MARTNPAAPAETTVLSIKNMVCDRCIRVVREELENLGLSVRSVRLGEAVVAAKGLEKKLGRVREILEKNGFELLGDKKAKLVERIKTVIIRLIHAPEDGKPNGNFSTAIARELGYDYPYLSRLFSSVENFTIERFIILQKIEHVKELLVYGELTLSEISYRLRYSSVQHLSNQFKQVTGFTPTSFRRMKGQKRKPIDQVVRV